MEHTGSDLLLNLDHVHRNRTNDEAKADGQRSWKCSVCLIGGIEHGQLEKSRARTRGVLIGKGLSEAEYTGERKDLCCWCPVRMRFPAEANGSASSRVGCGLESVSREGWSSKARLPSLLLPPPEILACNYGLSGKGFPVCMLSPFTPTYP